MSVGADISEKTSPMMIQWHTCKKQAGEALLLFRLGDFYEAFYQDAQVLSKELQLTLTKRHEIPMAGIPFHTSDQYIDKLVQKGYRIAIAEQVEDPKEVKGLVKREIVRVVTPGTLIQSSFLQEKSNNFLGCLSHSHPLLGFSVLDLTTAECRVFEFDHFSSFSDEFLRLGPKELIVSEQCFSIYQTELENLKKEKEFSLFVREDYYFQHEITYDFLVRHFAVRSLDSFGLQGMRAAINSTGALLSYVKEGLNVSIAHIQTLQRETSSSYMCLDCTTLKHLEILETAYDKTAENSLLHHIDYTGTPMGGRLLKQWLTHPLLSVEAIEKRQEAVSFFLQLASFNELMTTLSSIRDIERLLMRVETGFGTPRDLLGLRISLEDSAKALHLLKETTSVLLQEQHSKLWDVSPLTSKLQQALQEELPLRISDGNVIRPGFHKELDELRELCQDSHGWIARYQIHLREETGNKTLKIGYTKAFGYYIEVSRAQAEKMPLSFQRRQTLVNTERFITEELKEYEYKVLSAEEKIAGIEAHLFQELRSEVSSYSQSIRSIASAIAHVDALCSFAKVAKTHSYTKPLLTNTSVFHIEEGKHPVIAAHLTTDPFIPNDTYLDGDGDRLLLITGPNMAGKSTFIRQVALISILAQIGSFVPAKRASLSVIDKVFTRIGASDNLSKGQSTFMVEMTETANILHNATDKSLVILDEIGRGTSTYDGISIAWAVAEYLLKTKGKQAKTLFATHYCELIELEEKIYGAKNYHIAVHESEKGIVFLRKIIRGGTDKSYGIHVARLAGLPSPVIAKAQEILQNLEKQASKKPKKNKEDQFTFFLPPPEHPVLQEIEALDINKLTPLEALQTLANLKQSCHLKK